MDHRDLAGRFNARFRWSANTVLVGGGAEPVYLPATPSRPAMIRYARDHTQSVLHELAHWCLATPAARNLVDYGLTYQAPPRSPAQQARFYEAEVPVQALELLLAQACGVTFHISDDNPGCDDPPARAAFAARVRQTCRRLRARGPGESAVAVLEALTGAAGAGGLRLAS